MVELDWWQEAVHPGSSVRWGGRCVVNAAKACRLVTCSLPLLPQGVATSGVSMLHCVLLRRRVALTPAQHWSMRTPWTRKASLWGGFAVLGEKRCAAGVAVCSL